MKGNAEWGKNVYCKTNKNEPLLSHHSSDKRGNKYQKLEG
jgi:hypothetical protein